MTRRPTGFSFITAFHAGADVTIILIATVRIETTSRQNAAGKNAAGNVASDAPTRHHQACGFGWAKGVAYGVALAGCVIFTLNGFA